MKAVRKRLEEAPKRPRQPIPYFLWTLIASMVAAGVAAPLAWGVVLGFPLFMHDFTNSLIFGAAFGAGTGLPLGTITAIYRLGIVRGAILGACVSGAITFILCFAWLRYIASF